MKLGDIIASFRRLKRIGQTAMAEQCGVSVSYISQIENNSRKPSGKLLIRISEILDVSVSNLLYEAIDDPNFKDKENRKLFIKAKPMIDKMLGILLGNL